MWTLSTGVENQWVSRVDLNPLFIGGGGLHPNCAGGWMAEARLAAGIWVAAYLARLRLAAIPAYVTRKGDPTSGAVIVKVATLDGRARAFQRSFDLAADQRIWVVLAEGAEVDVDAALSRARARDRDLWVIELEDRAGRTLLDEEGLG
jgi:hypothetical protein